MKTYYPTYDMYLCIGLPDSSWVYYANNHLQNHCIICKLIGGIIFILFLLFVKEHETKMATHKKEILLYPKVL